MNDINAKVISHIIATLHAFHASFHGVAADHHNKVTEVTRRRVKSEKVHAGRKTGWLDGSNKHRTFTRETNVCVLCEATSQPSLIYVDYLTDVHDKHPYFNEIRDLFLNHAFKTATVYDVS